MYVSGCFLRARLLGFAALVIVSVMCGGRAVWSQTPVPAQTTAQPPATTQPPAKAASPDAKIVEGPPPVLKSRSELTAQAWKILSDAVTDEKHHDIQVQALSALGTMGSNARTTKMIDDAFADSDVDVRTAAVLAAGQTKNQLLLPRVKKMLDDKEPQVAYTAAVTLWKMGDHSGEDLLMAVIDGDRKASANLMNGSMHAANKELHDPAALAKMGALQGASMLLGPFGFGITAYEYIRKSGGGDSARVTALELVSQTKTPAVREELMGALKDKDEAVRAAAAKALRSYREEKVSRAVALLFDDAKRPVQFVAAASYLISTGVVMLPPPVAAATMGR